MCCYQSAGCCKIASAVICEADPGHCLGERPSLCSLIVPTPLFGREALEVWQRHREFSEGVARLHQTLAAGALSGTGHVHATTLPSPPAAGRGNSVPPPDGWGTLQPRGVLDYTERTCVACTGLRDCRPCGTGVFRSCSRGMGTLLGVFRPPQDLSWSSGMLVGGVVSRLGDVPIGVWLVVLRFRVFVFRG